MYDSTTDTKKNTEQSLKTVDCILGMQWGSEGKGKIVAYLANEYVAAVRSGGPQAGHIFYHQGTKYINRQVPCTVFNASGTLYISPNAIIAPSVLEQEIQRYKLTSNRLRIDRHAMILRQEHKQREEESSLKTIASTLQGVGAATADKIMRTAELAGTYAKRTQQFEEYIADVSKELSTLISQGKYILLEGTQGFGLSLSHGSYPHVTSREITDSALLSDAGISLRHHRKTIGVMRTYPIRVGGPSGPTSSKEVTWEEVTSRARSPIQIQEYSTVTKRLRRVFEQDWDILEDACRVNAIDEIAITGIDYIAYADHGKQQLEDLSPISRRYIEHVEEQLNHPVVLIGTGPRENEIIDLRK